MSIAQTVAATIEEPPIPVRKLPDFLSRKYGVRPHMATCHRWCLAGAHGHVLATFVIGGRRYAKPADVVDFIARLNGQPSTK